MKKFSLCLLVGVLLLATAPVSASDMGLKRLGGKVGIVFPKDLDMGFMLGAAADMGEITDNLKLVPLISYWNAGKSEGGYDFSLSNFQIGADVQYYLKDVKGLYFGGGLSINFASASVDVPPEIAAFVPETSSSSTDIGIDFLGGYEMPLGKTTTGFAQLKYNLISDLNTFEINLGVWFDMN